MTVHLVRNHLKLTFPATKAKSVGCWSGQKSHALHSVGDILQITQRHAGEVKMLAEQLCQQISIKWVEWHLEGGAQ